MRHLRAGIAILILSGLITSCTFAGIPAVTSTAVSGAGAQTRPSAVQTASELPSQDCTGDGIFPTVASSWKMVWHRVFDYAIARPPVIDGSQIVLVERADPDPHTMQDTALVIDPQFGIIQWKIVDAQQPVQFVSRRVISSQASQKYWLFVLQYLKPDQLGTPNPVQYEVVVDRQSGQVVYDSGVLSDAMVTAITDEALFDRYTFSFMRRVDLPSGQNLWTNAWHEQPGPRGLFVVGPWLYFFRNDQYAFKYNSLNGALVMSDTWGIWPNPGDVIVTGEIAIGRSEGKVVAFDLQRSLPIWDVTVGYLVAKGSNAFWDDIPSMTVTSDSIYVFDAHDILIRLDLQKGRTVWRASSPGAQAMSRPVVMRDLVYGFFSDGTVRAFSEVDGTQLGIVMQVPLWYWKDTDTKEWRDLVGGLGVAGDTLIVTTGCRSVYAIQREP